MSEIGKHRSSGQGAVTETDYLLVLLIEECAEIALVASKALRFGLDDSPPDGTRETTNAEEISVELGDLSVVFEMLRERNIVPYPDAAHKREKRAKVERFMDYSRKRGTLQ